MLHSFVYLGLSKLEEEVKSLHKKRAIACRSPSGHLLCTANATLVWYNPSNRDRFICSDIILGPKQSKVASPEERMKSDCWGNALKNTLIAHSFPMVPTVENKGEFPG